MMKKNLTMRNFRRKLLPLMIAACFSAADVNANPVGPQIVNGQVGITNSGNTLSITNTPGSIINWQSFSINPGEITRFIQQNPDSSVLNRIAGQDPSQILGTLQSNGRVFLINPNGILFGAGAKVDVNRLVASTLNLTNEDFLAGKMNFLAGSTAGNLQNQGEITTPSGGQVYLIASNVENTGIITSPKGNVVLAAGHTVKLVDSADPDLHVVISAPDNQALNLGQIIAQGGTTGIYGALVRQRGIVNADSAVVGENGKIVFKASKETILDAGSQTTAFSAGAGGEIHVLGNTVVVQGNAKIDASGQAGGGAILIGGDYQGKNPLIQNARRTYISADAALKADAIATGNGGKLIVWADGITQVHGNLSARGGASDGNGGLIETSGHYLDVAGIKIDTGVTKGKGSQGTWLLDPENIEVVASGGGSDLTQFDSAFDEPNPGTSQINADAISNATANVRLQASNDITFSAPINIAQSFVGLTATAGRDIAVNSSISTNNGDIALVAERDIAIKAAVTSSGVGSGIYLRANGNITQAAAVAAAITASRLGVSADGKVDLNDRGNQIDYLAALTNGGDFNFTDSHSFAIGNAYNNDAFGYGGSVMGVGSNGGNISLQVLGVGDVHVDGAINAGVGNVTLKAPGTVAVTTETFGYIAGNNLTVEAGQGINLITQVNSLNALNQDATGNSAIHIENYGPLTLYNVRQTGSSGLVGIFSYVDDGSVLPMSSSETIRPGNLVIASTVDAGSAGMVNLHAEGAIMNGGGMVKGNFLHADAYNGIALNTQVSLLDAFNSNTAGNADINISNVGPLSIQYLQQMGDSSHLNTGNIFISNIGALNVAATSSSSSSSPSSSVPDSAPSASNGVFADAGNISLVAHSPLTINGTVSSVSGNVALEAGSSNSLNDNLIINGNVSAGGGSILLRAGGAITINGSLAGTVTQEPNGNLALALAGAPGSSPILSVMNKATDLVTVVSDQITQQVKASVSDGQDKQAKNDDSESGSGGAGSKATTNDNGAKKNEAAKMYCN